MIPMKQHAGQLVAPGTVLVISTAVQYRTEHDVMLIQAAAGAVQVISPVQILPRPNVIVPPHALGDVQEGQTAAML